MSFSRQAKRPFSPFQKRFFFKAIGLKPRRWRFKSWLCLGKINISVRQLPPSFPTHLLFHSYLSSLFITSTLQPRKSTVWFWLRTRRATSLQTLELIASIQKQSLFTGISSLPRNWGSWKTQKARQQMQGGVVLVVSWQKLLRPVGRYWRWSGV